MYHSASELLHAAQQLAGLSLSELANQYHVVVPANLKKEKGWIGQLLELALGATAGSKPQQDFPEIGVELKTLPIRSNGMPLESTFVCTAPLLNQQQTNWHTSNVRNKLSLVLWIPIIGERTSSPGERIIGSPLLWSPSEEEELELSADWNEIMELISLGKIETISAKTGSVLQLRPKAANGGITTSAIGPYGHIIQTRPRGFYLRTSFTASILKKHFYL